MPQLIILNIHGGQLQDVFATDTNAEVIAVDWDTDGATATDPCIVPADLPSGRQALVQVARIPPQPISGLPGTDVAAALQAAGVEFRSVVPADPGPSYHFTLDGPLFREQRELLLRLREQFASGKPAPAIPADVRLLDGLIELTDAIADEAHDRHGVDCLLASG